MENIKKRMKGVENKAKRTKEQEKKYNKRSEENRDRISATQPAEKKIKERIEKAAGEKGISNAEYIIIAVETQLTKDGYPAPAEAAQAGR